MVVLAQSVSLQTCTRIRCSTKRLRSRTINDPYSSRVRPSTSYHSKSPLTMTRKLRRSRQPNPSRVKLCTESSRLLVPCRQASSPPCLLRLCALTSRPCSRNVQLLICLSVLVSANREPLGPYRDIRVARPTVTTAVYGKCWFVRWQSTLQMSCLRP